MASDDKKLIFLLVHGIGPQDKTLHDRFLAAVRVAVATKLGAGSADKLSWLVMLRADWSHLFKRESDEWLATLFPEHRRRPARRKSARRLKLYATIALLVTALVPIGVFELWHWCKPLTVSLQVSLRIPTYVTWLIPLTCATALAVVLVLLIACWRILLRRLPWGDVWSLGRGFEADNVSDILLYQSDGPRQKIVQCVLEELKPHLPVDDDPEGGRRNGLPIVLAAHSLGTVVIYDLLLGIVAARKGRDTAVSRELAMLDGSERSKGRKEFLQLVRRAQRSLRVIGMATFGSPIALFLFRKPGLLKRRDLWREACPPEFEETGMSEELRWQWPNFWHTADFVAHRLGPIFNQSFPLNGPKDISNDHPARLFVEDVRVRRPVQHPIAAHSGYWEDPAVIEGIGAQLADCLRAL